MAKLAPIIGAFLAGLALNKAEQGDRVRRELTPVGHILIPVFFLQIGVDVDIAAFGRAEVLRDAAVLLVVAVVGKLLSPLGAIGSPGDKPLIGLGMLPRGEVGLIFATIGLQTGVLGDDLYAALLLVVLVTTLVTPPLLKVRYQRLRADSRPPRSRSTRRRPTAAGCEVSRDEVDLRGAAARRARRADRVRRGDPARPAPPVGRPPRLAGRRRASTASRFTPRAHLEAARRDRARQRPLVAVPRDLGRARSPRSPSWPRRCADAPARASGSTARTRTASR